MSKTTFFNIAGGLAWHGDCRACAEWTWGVRPETAVKVIAAARSLDYPKRLPEVHRGILRIEVLLVRPETTFFRRLSRAFKRINATLDPSIRVYRTFMDAADPGAIAARIALKEREGWIDTGRAWSSDDRWAVSSVAAAGLPVVHIIKRAAEGVGDLVSIDNYAAGRTAALFLSRMQRRSGTVMALCHPIYQVHRERMRGFSDFLD